MSKIKVEVLGSADLPEDMKDALSEKLGEIFGRGLGEGEAHMKPATAEQVRALLEAAAAPKPKLGDVVTLRDHAQGKFKWPKLGDKVIVTQSLEVPFREGDSGTSMEGRKQDIAIAFVCPEGHVHEYLHDSRDFEIVGSVLN